MFVQKGISVPHRHNDQKSNFRVIFTKITSIPTSIKRPKIKQNPTFTPPQKSPKFTPKTPQTQQNQALRRNKTKFNIYIEINHHINVKVTITKSPKTLANKAFSVKVKTPIMSSLRSRQIQHNFFIASISSLLRKNNTNRK